MGGMFFLLAPMVYVALCASKRLEMSKINIYGVGWIMICLIIGLVGIGRGVTVYLIKKELFKEPLQLHNHAFSYMESYQRKRSARLFSHIIAGVIFCLFSSFFIITIYSISRTDYKLIELSYCCIFLLIGFGVMVLISTTLNYIISGKLRYVATGKEETARERETIGERMKCGMCMHRKLFTVVMIAAVGSCIVFIMNSGTWYVQPYISTIPVVDLPKNPVTYDKESGVYTITKSWKDFKILQLTDIHLGGSALSYSKDLKALRAVYDLITYTKPDLVIVTGDFVFPLGIESYSFNNYTPILQFASFMRNMGVCWAFTYGNHDTEFVASHSKDELNELFGKFAYQTTKTLLYPDVQPPISGRSNQVLLIKNEDGSVNQALFLIDSNSYSSGKLNDYDYIHDDQVSWYESEVKKLEKQQGTVVSSLIFTHIPLQEYREAYELYKKDSKEVTYYFGEVGEEDEAICCSDHKSRLFEEAVEEKSTKAIFVGHDHYNTIALGYKGIKMVYGMSIDYLAMPGIAKETKQRGGTLITLHENSTFDIQQIPLRTIQKKYSNH